MERVNASEAFEPSGNWRDRVCIHKIPFSEPCSLCKEWRADDPPAGEFSDNGPTDIRERSEHPVSRETVPEPKRGPEWLEPDTSVGPPEFEEFGVWTPRPDDYRRWEHNARPHFHRGYIPDWYEWAAEDATWD